MEKCLLMESQKYSVFEIINEKGWDLNSKILGINYIGNRDSMKNFLEQIQKRYKLKEIIEGEVGIVVATHGGPGAIAMYFEE